MQQRELSNWNDETKIMPAFQNEDVDYQEKAKALVRQIVEESLEGFIPPPYTIYVVWFCKTLQNWKGLLSTTMPDHRYFEVTYNGDLRETYVDTYVKSHNQKFLDSEI